MIIAIDFDNTICEQAYPAVGALKTNAREIIQKLYDEGHEIIVWTCRSSGLELAMMMDFLKDHNIPYHSINENAPSIEKQASTGFANRKIFAHVYIDDRSLLGIPDWNEIYNIMQTRLSEGKILLD